VTAALDPFAAWRAVWPDQKIRRTSSLAARGLGWELMALTRGSGVLRVGEPDQPWYLQQARLGELIGAPNPRELAHAIGELRDVGLVVARDGLLCGPRLPGLPWP
jgi:hypothetical protein